jgi:hypothetical protein
MAVAQQGSRGHLATLRRVRRSVSEDSEKLSHGYDLHSMLSQLGNELQVSLDIVVAGYGELALSSNGSFQENVVLGITTDMELPGRIDVYRPYFDSPEELG